MKARSLLIQCVLLSLGCPSCAHRAPQFGDRASRISSQAVTIKGSDTMVLLGQWWAENYLDAHPQRVIQVNGGGSGTGIAALLNGTTDICQSSRPIKPQERAACRAKYQHEVVEIKVALDGLGVYVNAANPVQALTLAQVRDIYTGKLTDWRMVGGTPGKIILYSRENNSGTYEFFKEHVLANADFASRTQPLSGNAAVINAVSHDPAGIGYGGIAFAKGVKALALQRDATTPAVAPDFAHVVDGSYPLSRALYWYLPGEPTGEIKSLVEWATSAAGQALVQEVGYFPLPTTGAQQ